MTSDLVSAVRRDAHRSATTILATTLASLGDDEVALTVGRPRGARWVPLGTALEDEAVLRGWLAARGLTASAPERARTMFLASWLTALVVNPLARSVLRHGRGWTLAPEHLHVRPTVEGWFDGLAIDGATVLVGPADAPPVEDAAPASASGIRRLPTRDAVIDVAAEEATSFGTAVLAAMRRVGTIGAPAFWGALADNIVSSFVYAAATAGEDVPSAFRDGQAFMDAIARHVPTGRARPDLLAVRWSGGTAHELRRGTFCLWYQTEPAGDDYCTSCPKRDRDEQVREWATWLEEEAAAERSAAPPVSAIAATTASQPA